jgi:hypothetical protein
MNTRHGAMLGLAIAAGNLGCLAQQAAIPFEQLKHTPLLYASLATPDDKATVSLSTSSFSTAGAVGEPFASGVERMPPVRVQRTASARYFLLNGFNFGMAALDVGMTQHCIANHQCREGNPLMPSSLAGQIGVDAALAGYGSCLSYKLKKRRSKMWWLAPTTGIVAHGVGAATGFAHR